MQQNNPFFKILNSNKLKLIVFILVLIYSFSRVFLGLDFTDTFSFINLFSTYSSVPSIELTLFIGHCWKRVFGDSLFAIRTLSWLCTIFSILIPYLVLIEKRLWKEKVHYISIILLIFPGWIIYSADTISILFASLSLTIMIKYYLTRKLVYIPILSASSAILIFARFPNVLLLPVIIVLIPVIESYSFSPKEKVFWGKTIKLLLFFCLSNIVFFTIFSFLLNGGVNNYIKELRLDFNQLNNNGHGLANLIFPVINDTKKIIFYLGVLFFYEFLFSAQQKITIKKTKLIILSIIYGSFFFLIFTDIFFSEYFWNLSLLLSSIIIYKIIKAIYNNYVTGQKEYKNVFYLIVFSFAIVLPMGSNTGLLKLLPIFICFLPIILIWANIKLSEKKYLFPIFSLFIMIIVLMYTKTYQDQREYKLTTTVQNEKQLKYIHTTKGRAKYVQDIMNDYSMIKKGDNKKVLFYGPTSHIFYYLTKENTVYKNTFSMNSNNEIEVRSVEDLISKLNFVVFYLPEYPEAVIQGQEYTKFEKMLIKNHYKESDKGSYKIYTNN